MYIRNSCTYICLNLNIHANLQGMRTVSMNNSLQMDHARLCILNENYGSVQKQYLGHNLICI